MKYETAQRRLQALGRRSGGCTFGSDSCQHDAGTTLHALRAAEHTEHGSQRMALGENEDAQQVRSVELESTTRNGIFSTHSLLTGKLCVNEQFFFKNLNCATLTRADSQN